MNGQYFPIKLFFFHHALMLSSATEVEQQLGDIIL